MPMSTEDGLDRAHATALQRWQAPFPDFASGHDRRTSDAGLLELFYGGLLFLMMRFAPDGACV